jgi:hypothetical protein
VFSGSFGDGIDKTLLAEAGVRGGAEAARENAGTCKATNRAAALVENVPATFETYCYRESGTASPESNVIYSEEGASALTLLATSREQVAAWDPPDVRSLEGIPLSQIWGNTGAPFALAAGVLSEMLKTDSCFRPAKIDLKQTVNVAAWQTQDGGFRILTGNLEEGLRDDADFTRSAALLIPDSWRMAGVVWRDAWTGHTINAENGALRITLPQASSVLLEQTR